jgi:uncharacterized phiE125 gp8 family phage protein
MALRVLTTPTTLGLITLADAKLHLRVETDDDDALITEYIAAASDQVEAYTQRRYWPQVLQWSLQEWRVPMRLPVAPGGAPTTSVDNIAVTQIQYADLTNAGVMDVLDPSLYWAKPLGETLSIVPQWYVVWPWLGDAPERVLITFAIGPNSAPSNAAIAATKLLTSHYYQNREAVVGVENRDSSGPLPMGVETLLFRDRWDR